MNEKLAATLDELHRELATIGPGDVEVQQLLRGALAEIQAALDAAASGNPADDEPLRAGACETPTAPAAWRTPLADAAQHFEASHPTLAGLISSLLDALARMGV